MSGGNTKKITFSEFMDKVENDQIISAYINGNVVSGDMNPEEDSEYTKLRDHHSAPTTPT